MSMFKAQKDEEPTQRMDAQSRDHTVIGHSVKVEGDFSSNDNVTVEGAVNGSLKTDKNLLVGEKAEITAEVIAASAVIAGSVKGNIKVSASLKLKSSARVEGDITTKRLVIEDGAVFNGQCHMNGSAPSQPVQNKTNKEGEEKK